MRRLAACLVAFGAIVLAHSTPGWAATTHLGTQGVGVHKTLYAKAYGSFKNDYKFRVAKVLNIGAKGNVIFKSGYNIKNFRVSLYERHATKYKQVRKLASDSGKYVSLNVSGLDVNKRYFFYVTGDAKGKHGGKYKIEYQTSAVPLPPAIWLFLTAVVGLVGVVRQKRKRNAKAEPLGAPA
ncbi:MAG: hypothetical protein AAF530_20870 [Pseudomonadota bacterium]